MDNTDDQKIITSIDNFQVLTILNLNNLREQLSKVQTQLKFAKNDIDFLFMSAFDKKD